MAAANSWIDLVVPILFGGIAGAVVSGMFSKSLSRRQLTISTINDYLDKYLTLQSTCEWMLQNPNHPDSKNSINDLIRFGNWAESFAVLYHRKMIDRKVVDDYGLTNQLQRHYKQVRNSILNTDAKYESLKNLEKL